MPPRRIDLPSPSGASSSGATTGWGPKTAGNFAIALADGQNGVGNFTISFANGPATAHAVPPTQHFPNLNLEAVRIDNTGNTTLTITWTDPNAS